MSARTHLQVAIRTLLCQLATVLNNAQKKVPQSSPTLRHFFLALCDSYIKTCKSFAFVMTQIVLSPPYIMMLSRFPRLLCDQKTTCGSFEVTPQFPCCITPQWQLESPLHVLGFSSRIRSAFSVSRINV